MQDIFEDATIIYKNGLRKVFDAISITSKGVYTGYVNSKNESEEKFVNNTFIPRNKIKKIMIFNEDGKSKDIVFKNLYLEEKIKWKEK